ncbi:MAG TPA: bacillithiol biosynthesis cysteine-adding enzyme BshC [Chitinophagales bacterium]|nr:bacillithiol biosynthesis cysteine-adding enzyme BshC [Chitinophagales bacterium]
MTVTQIPFSQTNLFSKLILDYISADENVKPFYNYEVSIDAIENVITEKQKEIIDRKVLVETIKKQYAGLEVPAHVSENIKSLENPTTFCVVTAHQLNVFGGPLYYIYKIAQTISTCNQLKTKFPNYNFVPVYWLGSEDHDFEEINHIYLYSKKIEWQDKQGGATGEYSTNSISPLIEEIKTILGESEFANQLIEIFQKAYAQPTLTHAARYLLNALFGAYGLVVVDGNDSTFKQQYAAIMRDELVHQNSFKLVTQQLAHLDTKGYKQQAFPREINLFYLSKNSRERIVKENSEFRIQNSELKFTESEILNDLQNHPERFSPNVILRPLFQQKILPSLAYIGGAGELSYWLQLKPVFDFYKVNFPQLLLRNSALLINEATLKKIDKIGFALPDFFKTTDELKKEFIAGNTEENIDFAVYKSELEATFEKVKELAKNIDASLVNTVGAELQKSLQSIDSIEKRLLKSLKQKNETELNQIEKIKNQLFPNNSLQERVENFSAYYAKYGQAFITDLIEAFDVYNKQILLIQFS